MKFPTMTPSPERRLTVPTLNGGIHTEKPAAFLEDDQLQNSLNLWLKEGELCSRPVTSPCATLPLYDVHGTESVHPVLQASRVSLGDAYGRHLCLTVRGGDLPEGKCALRYIGISDDGRFTDDHGFLPPVNDNVSGLYIDAGGTAGEKQQLVMLGGELYRLKNGGYESVAPYRPLRLIRAKGHAQNVAAETDGYTLESRNLLTDGFRAAYAPNEDGIYFPLPEAVTAGTVTLTATEADGKVHVYTLVTDGTNAVQKETVRDAALRLCYAPSTRNLWLEDASGTAVAPLQHGQVEWMLDFNPANDAPLSKQTLGKMTFGAWFGGNAAGIFGGTRFFISGNPEEPHLVHYSALNNPTYFPALSYFYVGASSDAVTAFGRQNDRLIVFKEHTVYAVRYAASETDTDSALNGGIVDSETQSAVFSVVPISDTVGCDIPQSIVLCGDRTVWTNADGRIYALTGTDPYRRHNLAEIGEPIRKEMRVLTSVSDFTARATYVDGHYALCIGDHLFLLHRSCLSSLSSATEAALHRQLIWHHWKLPSAPFALFTDGDTLMYAATDILEGKQICVTYCLREGDTDTFYQLGQLLQAPLRSEFITKAFDFGYPDRYKHIQRLSLEVYGKGVRMELGFENENGRTADCRYLSTVPSGLLSLSVGIRRARRCALHCRAEGQVAYGACALSYHLFAK